MLALRGARGGGLRGGGGRGEDSSQGSMCPTLGGLKYRISIQITVFGWTSPSLKSNQSTVQHVTLREDYHENSRAMLVAVDTLKTTTLWP